MRSTVTGIIQARMGSSRLPYKMLLSLHGTPIIEWVVRRVRTARRLDTIMAAIPDNARDDILAAYLSRLNVNVHRGPEEDVLLRFCQAAQKANASHIVRICADNPLICGQAIDQLIGFYFNTPCDYAYNHIPRGNSYPDGIGAEIVSRDLLEELNELACLSHHREHCFSYIFENPERFIIKTFDPPNPHIAFPRIRLDIDTYEDFCRLAKKDFDIETPTEELIQIFMEGENED